MSGSRRKGLGLSSDEPEDRSGPPVLPGPPSQGTSGRRIEQRHEQWKRGGAGKKFLSDAMRDLDEKRRRTGGTIGRKEFEQWKQSWVQRRFDYHEDFEESAANDMLEEHGW